MIINRVRPLSVGKIAAFIYGIIGLFIGAVIAVFALFGGLLPGRPAPPATRRRRRPRSARSSAWPVSRRSSSRRCSTASWASSARSSWRSSTTSCRASSAGSKSTSASAGGCRPRVSFGPGVGRSTIGASPAERGVVRTMRVACVLLLAVALSACYQSTLPLGPPERGTIDSALVGTWSCVDPRDATNRAVVTSRADRSPSLRDRVARGAGPRHALPRLRDAGRQGGAPERRGSRTDPDRCRGSCSSAPARSPAADCRSPSSRRTP